MPGWKAVREGLGFECLSVDRPAAGAPGCSARRAGAEGADGAQEQREKRDAPPGLLSCPHSDLPRVLRLKQAAEQTGTTAVRGDCREEPWSRNCT